MKTFRILTLALAWLLLPAAAFADGEEIVVESAALRLTLGADGAARSLICKATGEECLTPGVRVPFCAITQYRPYDNENFLMFPAKPRVFPSNRIERRGDELYVEFQDTYDIAVIGLQETDSYVGFTLRRIDYRLEDVGLKRKTEIDEFALMQLPVREREHFGEWLNVCWDDRTAVAVVGTHPATRIDAFAGDGYRKMYAGTDFQVQLTDAGAALVVSGRSDFLDRIDRLERDYGMPLGVESRRHEAYRCSYYELRDVTTANIDEHIAYALQGGFRSMVVYYMDFASSCGHFLWRDEFPGGLDDLKIITAKIRAAGLIPGFHIHYSKVSKSDPYLCGGVPDPRLNGVRELILREPLGAADTEIVVEGNPDGCHLEEGRRLLQIGDELIGYEGYTTTPPYRFTGCRRGEFGSTPAAHPRGVHFRLLDVDTWPDFIRIDQRTTLQDEIAERLGTIYREAGFRFVYFDGAEDVPMPYWYNVSRSQAVVYDRLAPAPIFCEGALKSHYGWHMLSRGNAFDLFRPEQIRQGLKRYTLRCARRIADDFTSVDFGWTDYLAPDSTTVGMQPDMYEYVCGKALAWDAPISLVGKIDQIRKHPRTADNLEVMRWWEEAKLNDVFDAEQRERLRDPDSEFLLLKGSKGEFELYSCRQIVSDGERPVRAFLFERDGRNCIVYWHVSGSGEVRLDAGAYAVRLTDTKGRRAGFSRRGGVCILPAAGRLIVESDMPADELVRRFRAGALLETTD